MIFYLKDKILKINKKNLENKKWYIKKIQRNKLNFQQSKLCLIKDIFILYKTLFFS